MKDARKYSVVHSVLLVRYISICNNLLKFIVATVISVRNVIALVVTVNVLLLNVRRSIVDVLKSVLDNGLCYKEKESHSYFSLKFK